MLRVLGHQAFGLVFSKMYRSCQCFRRICKQKCGPCQCFQDQRAQKYRPSSISTVYLRGAQTLSVLNLILAIFLGVICLFLFLSFRLGVAVQRSFCMSVFLSFRLGVTLQLCFVLAFFLCCFLLAGLVIIR